LYSAKLFYRARLKAHRGGDEFLVVLAAVELDAERVIIRIEPGAGLE
jgi:hypothetical protein